ncbi:hypothetical protein BCR43DRAFT_226573 [Syncephalastrum racemosum]|uniref:Uncharacterized protein n=1 Tax=Syncephalastrum racemosum TaxID=13706 RepID=A0A1X2HJX3_SYNRA|nr:hypothetical protein BCR43DRAFT_226573 [Syncephalastrum racemosum]
MIDLFHVQEPRLITEHMNRYARWARLCTSVTLKVDKSRTYDCLSNIVESLCRDNGALARRYPQKELYYLLVVAWNDGVSRLQSGDFVGGCLWCQLSFSLLPFITTQEHLREKVIRWR